MGIHIDKKGSWQTGTVQVPLQPLEVCVQDDEGLPVPKLTVRFRLNQGSGHFTHRDDETDIKGCAIAEFVPEAPGEYRIDCLVGGRGGRSTQFCGSVAAESGKSASLPIPLPTTEEPAAEDRPQPADETMGAVPAAAAPMPPPSGETAPEQPAADAENSAAAAAVPGETAAETPAGGKPTDDAPPAPCWEPEEAGRPRRSPLEQAVAQFCEEQPTVTQAPRCPSRLSRLVGPLKKKLSTPAVRLGNKGKIGLAALAMVITIALFVLARMSGPVPASGIAVQPVVKTIDCAGSSVKQVGRTYVFENCVVGP